MTVVVDGGSRKTTAVTGSCLRPFSETAGHPGEIEPFKQHKIQESESSGVISAEAVINNCYRGVSEDVPPATRALRSYSNCC